MKPFWFIVVGVLVIVCGLIVSSVFNGLFDDPIKAKVKKNKKISIGILIGMIILFSIIGIINNQISNQKDGDSNTNAANNSDSLKANLKEEFSPHTAVNLPDTTNSKQTSSEQANDSILYKKSSTIKPEQDHSNNKNETGVSYAENLVPRKQIIRFLEAENAIETSIDIQNVINFYSFPMRKNFKYTAVSSEHLYNIYKLAYLNNFPYHKIKNYDDQIKVIFLSDGRTRVEVTFQFEISRNKDGTNSKVQQVSNAYVFNADGKIESVGLATDKNL